MKKNAPVVARQSVYAGSAAIGLMAGLAPVVAAEMPSAESLLEEVVVTATRTGATSLHDTPISITAFSSDYLNDMVVTDIRDVAIMTPGMTLTSNANMAQVYIRGIGSNNVFAGADPSSTIHVDGVYMARPQSGFSNFSDVERVEILRGPQGTLYGRNSVGGTVSIVSRSPSLDRLVAEGTYTLGNESFNRLEGYLSAPLIEDTLAFSTAVQLSDRDAFRENIAPDGHDVDDEDIRSYRGQLLWNLSEQTNLVMRGDYYEDNSTLYSGSSSPLAVAAGNPPLAGSIVGDSRKVALNAPSFIDREASGVSLEVNNGFGEHWSLKSLIAYRSNENYIASDPDVTELDLNRTLLWEDQEQYSVEFNLVGTYEKAQYFLGAFALKEEIEGLTEVQVRPSGISVELGPEVDTETWALFGQVEYDLTPALSLSAGARYTEETKDWFKTHGVFLTGTDILLTGIDLPAEKGEYDEFTPKLGVEFTPSDDYLFYGSVSRGFKSGGFNMTAGVPGGYDPETLLAYEIGFNGRHADGRVTSRLSVFYYDYDDLQVQAFITPGVASITNAASARVKGLEAEFSGRVTDEFTLRGNLAYLDATYSEYAEAPVGGGAVIDASGNHLNSAPEWSASGFAEYARSFDWGLVRLTGEMGWQSESFFTVSNDDLHRQGSYAVANASLGYETPDGRFTVSIWGRNVLDKEYLTSAGTIVNPAGRYGPIRTYGLRFSAKY